MMTLAAITPSGLRRSASGRRPSTTSGPLPRTGSATSAGSGTEAPAKATHSVPRAPPPDAPGDPFSTSIPSTRFMPGLPRKWATNTLVGCAYRSSGAATCCSLPALMTAMRWPIVIASTWSWVT